MAIENSLINQIKNSYIKNRIQKIDSDFLEFEENMISVEDQNRILTLLKNKINNLSNNNNSIILYICGITDEFDFEKARSNTIGGSPPDIDIDHDALEREKAIQWVVDYWGRENVANIITHGTFKPKSLTRSWYRVTEGDPKDLDAVLKQIPKPKYGKEATLEEILEINPSIKEEEKYSDFYKFANQLEDMVANFGIHAAGLVISDNPIMDVVPTWKNSKADAITQFDMKEVEDLGLIKFDFLSIDTLSIIKQAVKLIEATTGKKIDPYSIEDGDSKAYTMMEEGMLTGVFQMETSGMAKKLISKIQPRSIEELSDISALNRPGPLQARLDKQYIDNKNNGYPQTGIPKPMEELLKNTNWTLIYQEQVMAICSDIAGFTAKESDDIRRAMGKKNVDVLNEYKEQFIKGCTQKGGLTQSYSEDLWEDMVGFADYCLAGSTKIRTSKGLKTIDELFFGDDYKFLHEETVKSLNDFGNIIYQEVNQLHCKGIKNTYVYQLHNGKEIICTPDHKFLLQNNEMAEIENIFNEKLELKILEEEIENTDKNKKSNS